MDDLQLWLANLLKSETGSYSAAYWACAARRIERMNRLWELSQRKPNGDAGQTQWTN